MCEKLKSINNTKTGEMRSWKTDAAFRNKRGRMGIISYPESTMNFCSNPSRNLKQKEQLSALTCFKKDIKLLTKFSSHEPIESIIGNIHSYDEFYYYHEQYFGVCMYVCMWNYEGHSELLIVAKSILAPMCEAYTPKKLSMSHEENVPGNQVPRFLGFECYQVVCGGIPETTELLKEKFDYIFYTGSPQVGRIVREAANKQLTPTTLELGGKSPLYIDDTVDMDIAVRRIMWGKCINVGQTCIAPDYVLCSSQVQDKFISKAKEVLTEWYGENPEASSNLCRIISDKHVDRLSEYLKDGEVAIGGQVNKDEKYIAPTILINVPETSKVMTEEIFGPILPIFQVNSAYDAIKFINARERPLTCYIFTCQSEIQKLLTENVRSGNMCINDTMLHLSIHDLPFGGVGNSGMGAYHGKESFNTFTHKKSCLIRNYNKIADAIGSKRYPPYSEGATKFLSAMLQERWMPSLKYLPHLISFGLGVASVFAVREIAKDGI
ncbi:unnamed protein product, partial [Meganyctiphanes norvegica]